MESATELAYWRGLLQCHRDSNVPENGLRGVMLSTAGYDRLLAALERAEGLLIAQTSEPPSLLRDSDA
jgi:hypothetical protein